ncbi:retrotransposon protein [Cucumis melo var. makuwa]|uniref:Retrotransposon protein n=1 Tax=Cucumis melo var. makuwa TaxID=1194695 RepID=A0A5D3BND1_CUCMM|nr:retrotransposon protein [Cucumis melo var. makuwa]TYK01253.1 retrotransposon protein [Cucumis melo var. makuwa]
MHRSPMEVVLDDIYVKVNVLATDRSRYRTWKDEVAINILGVYDTKEDKDTTYNSDESIQSIEESLSNPSRKVTLPSPDNNSKENVPAHSRKNDSSCSGFSWNDEFKCIIAKKELFNWSHPAAKGLINKSFPYYDDLSYVFGKDHATGARIEIFAMWDQMCQEAHDLVAQVKVRSKRKWGGQTTKTVNIIRNTIEYAKDQLKAIAEWMNVQHQVLQEIEILPMQKKTSEEQMSGYALSRSHFSHIGRMAFS